MNKDYLKEFTFKNRQGLACDSFFGEIVQKTSNYGLSCSQSFLYLESNSPPISSLGNHSTALRVFPLFQVCPTLNLVAFPSRSSFDRNFPWQSQPLFVVPFLEAYWSFGLTSDVYAVSFTDFGHHDRLRLRRPKILFALDEITSMSGDNLILLSSTAPS